VRCAILARKVRQAMTMTDGARLVAAGFAATGGVARGADLIEQRVLRSSRTTGDSRYELASS
jgi:UDP:flavonoid glycosyltransferase YjiC (YdhE family)